MKVIKEYPKHHYVCEFEKTELHCPQCAEKWVWVESGPGDYYVGPNYVCTSCFSYFNMPIGPERNEVLEGVCKQLNSGVTATPTTPEGN